jgi:hypothetical protein
MPPLFLYAGGTTSASSANAWHTIPTLNGQSRLAVMKAGEVVNRIKSCLCGAADFRRALVQSDVPSCQSLLLVVSPRCTNESA